MSNVKKFITKIRREATNPENRSRARELLAKIRTRRQPPPPAGTAAPKPGD